MKEKYLLREFSAIPNWVTEIGGKELDGGLTNVLEATQGIQIIEYDSGRAGPLVVITSGVHGEETRNMESAAIKHIEQTLEKHPPQNGNVLLVPNVNAPGCIKKTRFVFPDERETNLNDFFGYYNTGNWDEFFEFSTKTGRYAWLFMRFLTERRRRHLEKYGDQESILFDIHREERCLPHIRIDRMFENRELLEALLSEVIDIEIPVLLEYKSWERSRLSETLSSSAINQGFLGYTIEESRTVRPSSRSPRYVASELLRYINRKGMLARRDEDNDVLNKHAVVAARNLCKHIRSGHLLSLYDLTMQVKTRNSQRLSRQQLLSAALAHEDWDGTINVVYQTDLLGTTGTGSEKRLASFTYGQGTETDGFLSLRCLAQGTYIVSLPESYGEDEHDGRDNHVLRYGFFPEGDNLVLRRMTGEKPLDPRRLGQCLNKNPNIGINIEDLVSQCVVAKPDNPWKMEITDDRIKLIGITY